MPPHSAPFSALRRSMFVFAAAAVLSTTTTAFVVPSSFTSTTSSSSSSSTALFISSWGAKGPPAFRQASARDPEKRIQDYLPEPGAVEARSNIDGTILVSSSSSSSDSISSNDAQPPQQQRTDQFLFDLLNHQDSAFEFKTITAFVQDAAVAKKKLLSRSARYTGLLDKLQFVQALDGDQPYSLPTVEQLQGVKTWLAVLEHHHSSPPLDTATATANENNNNGILLERCHAIAKLVASVDSIENIAILLLGANELDAVACQSVVDALAATGNQYTIVGVGHVEDDRPEGSTAYHYGTFGTPTATTTTTSGDTTTAAFLPNKAVFAREEAYRLVTELLQLECGVNQTLLFAEVYNPNVTEAKLIKGLREAGYARPQEIDHMIRLGPKVCVCVCVCV